MSLRLSEALKSKIEEHASATYPEECCGALLGKTDENGKEVREILELGNSKGENRERRYLITPEEYQEAEKQASDRDLKLVGFYHSHPDHPSRPSEFDKEHALPWWSYLIVSVQQGKAEQTECWLLREDRSQFDPEELLIQET